ncbi:hypothetical protein [Vibrio sp. CAU 1672]|uniref:hypothetical protein n=1 Tax=Vibrio sp. CAU 1672 TaxID=3032594 RepID=UPI0023D9ACE8|nr:hypothetical protein [Vibrio sp. CAU 1672]MDF2155405.1 hypothetical protein [Vibrio sp. CAU 1672]
MSISGIQAGHQILQSSQNMVKEAAHDLQQAIPKVDDALNFNKAELVKTGIEHAPLLVGSEAIVPVIALTQAAGYNRIGASVVEKNNEVIGSLLDIHV